MRRTGAAAALASVTTAVGFASLALVPIPPVQVFGIFVAIGVLLAWLLSVTFIPAYIALLSEKTRGRLTQAAQRSASRTGLIRGGLLGGARQLTARHPLRVLLVSFALVAACFVGITRIEVNDNPNMDRGIEDRYLGDELYRLVMAEFLRRIEAVKA